MSAPERILPTTLALAQLGILGDPVAGESGESTGIHRIGVPPGARSLLFKQYKKTATRNGRDAALDQLIAFGRATDAVGRAEREVLLGSTSWPVAKVVDNAGELVGCLIPEADRRFRRDDGRLREIDILAQSDQRLWSRGMSVTDGHRLAACCAIARVAAALERRGLVYSDWNYANALWSPGDGAVFIIDIDGCRSGQMSNIYQNGWEDPLSLAGTADVFTDRYRVALLAARCLTGHRDLPSVLHALNDAGNDPVRSFLLDMIWAASRDTRPPPRVLLTVLGGASIGFRVPRRALPPRPNKPVRTEPAKIYIGIHTSPPGGVPPVPVAQRPTVPPTPPPGPNWAAALFYVVVIAILVVLAIAHAHH